jgi:hypothetical protein
VAREQNETEREMLAALYTYAKANLADRPKATVKLATVPIGNLPEGVQPADAAAMTVVGSVLLNLDEMFLKR